MTKDEIGKEFTKGDLRGKGGVDNVLKAYKKDNSIRRDIFDFVFSSNRLLAMRAMDAFEKIVKETGVTEEERDRLFEILDTPKPKEFMWHYVQILGYIEIPKNLRNEVFDYLKKAVDTYLDSNIVRVFSMQTLFDQYIEDEKYSGRVLDMVNEMSQSSIFSLRARANKLLKLYNKSR